MNLEPRSSSYDSKSGQRGPRGPEPQERTASHAASGGPGVIPADRDLLRRMVSGDEGALGELYDRWSTLVHSLVIRIVKDAEEAEETVEATFWQAWRQAARYDESRGAVSTWLTTIARSRALDRVRARSRVPEQSISRFGEEIDSVPDTSSMSHDPHANAEASERRDIVVAAMATLPVEQRETIELAYFSGLSQSEIAERTGQPLGTVKTRARLALDKLRERLSQFSEGVL
ncbi:MAG: sigma-70 family RNA polymerase sigma factor [Gemmatimonadaceae bacterium]